MKDLNLIIFQRGTVEVQEITISSEYKLKAIIRPSRKCLSSVRPKGIVRSFSPSPKDKAIPQLSTAHLQYPGVSTLPYLANVLEVLDVVALGAHDFIDDVGSHLVSVLNGPAETQAVGTWVQVAILHVAGSLLHTIFLVHP